MSTKHRAHSARGRGRMGDQPTRPWSAHDPRRSALPRDWRERLPTPAVYFARHVCKLGSPNAEGWAQGVCPFHADDHPSLSVRVLPDGGHWRCFAGCGHGDMLSFHMKMTGLPFNKAVCDLLGVRA